MPRQTTVRVNTKTARQQLAQRVEPYWHMISQGCALGFRKGKRNGSWVARFRDDRGKQHYRALGTADNTVEADGTSILSFSQALDKARAFFGKNFHEPKASAQYTVADALHDYFVSREHRGSKGVRADKYAAAARIIPALGDIPLAKLTGRRLRGWHEGLANSDKLVRTSKFAARQAVKQTDQTNQEASRARRSTANRILTVLKAALNHAYQEGRVNSDEAWRKIKPFRAADAPAIRYLMADECSRLVNACEPDFRNLVRAALLTGCRYGEIIRLECGDYNRDSNSVLVRKSKSGKPRHVYLNQEGATFFLQQTAGRPTKARMFLRSDGKVWGASHQQRPLLRACETAKIDPAVTFHALRHTYASALAMNNCSLLTIATQLGHSDTRMCEKHYAHLASNYIATTIRGTLPEFGILEKNTTLAVIR
jgi:integrase